jgi:uncharacterized membrane protein
MVARIDTRHLIPIALGYGVSIALYSKLPAALDAPSFVPLRPFTAFMLPTATAITIALMQMVWSRDSVRTLDAPATDACRAIGYALTLFVMAIHILAMVNLAGGTWIRPWAPRLVVILFGALLIGVGNLLPRTRPNLVVGVRTQVTLGNRQIWMQVNRVAGYATVGVGTVMIASGALLSHPTIAWAINAALIIAASTFAFSYRHYARLHG